VILVSQKARRFHAAARGAILSGKAGTMKTRLLSLPVFFLVAAFAFAQGEAKNDLEKFQGNWAVESVIVEGKELPAEVVMGFKMAFKDDGYTVLIGQDKTEGVFRVDASKKPKTIDIIPDNGPDRGLKQPGIYEFDGDKLKICAAQPGKERPTNFETKDKMGYTVMILRRVK
jgi:uncharacterized protein (TIGR03067 family)